MSEKQQMHELKTDVQLLLECLKYQADNPNAVKQALLTLSSIFSNCDAKIKEFFQEIGGIQFLFSTVTSVTNCEVKEAALFCLGCCIEKNVFSQKLLSTSSTFKYLHELLSDERSTTRLKQTAAFFLLCLVSNNSQGQSLTKSSLCLSDLLELLRTSLPKNLTSGFSKKESWFDDAGSTSLELWSSVASALCMCVNNPQNEQNQRVCGFVLPQMFSILEQYRNPLVIRPLISLIGLVVASNSHNQEQVRRCNGLKVLVKCLKNTVKLVKQKSSSPQTVSLAIQITSTIDSCITDNAENCEEIGKEGAVAIMLDLLNTNPSLDNAAKLQLVVTLGHAIELSDNGKKELCEERGLTKLIQHLTDTEDEEFSKAVKYLLQLCVTSKDNCTENQEDSLESQQRNEFMHLQSGLVLLQKINDITDRLKTIEKESTENSRNLFQSTHLASVPEYMGHLSDTTTKYNQSVVTDNLCLTPREKGLLYQLQKERKERQWLELLTGQNVCKSQFSQNTNVIDRNCDKDSLHHQQHIHQPELLENIPPKTFNIQSGNSYSIDTDCSGDHVITGKQTNCSGVLESKQSNSATLDAGNVLVSGNFEKGRQTIEKECIAQENCHGCDLQTQTHFNSNTGSTVFESAEVNIVHTNQIPKLTTTFNEYDKNLISKRTNESTDLTDRRHVECTVISSGISSNKYKKLNVSLMDNPNENKCQNEHFDGVASQIEHVECCETNKTVGSQCNIVNSRTPCNTKSAHISNYTESQNEKSDEGNNVATQCNIENSLTSRNTNSEQPHFSNCTESQNEKTDEGNNVATQCNIDNSLTSHNTNSTQPEPQYAESQNEKTGEGYNVATQCDITASDAKDNFDTSKMEIVNRDSRNVAKGKITVNLLPVSLKPTTKNDNHKFLKPIGVPLRKTKSVRSIRMTKPLGLNTSQNLTNKDGFDEMSSFSDVQSEFDCQLLKSAVKDKNDKSSSKTLQSLTVDRNFTMNRFTSSSSNADRTPKSQPIPFVKPVYSDVGPGRNSHKPFTKHQLNSSYSVKPVRKPRWMSAERGNSLGVPKHKTVHVYEDAANNFTITTAGSPGTKTGEKKLKENCPGCTGSIIEGESGFLRMNSRTYNLIIETNGATCNSHRTIREIERKYIETVKKVTKSTSIKRLKRKPLQILHTQNDLADQALEKKAEKDEGLYDFHSSSDSEIHKGNVTPPHSRSSSIKTVLSRKYMDEKRRPRIPYSDEEINNILTGVQTMGTRWNQILCTYVFHPSRTAVDLSDKYKRLIKGKKKNDDDVSVKSSYSRHEPFSMCEDRRLRRGVQRYGYSWKTILQSSKFATGRTSEDLRNRWRSMHKKPGVCKPLDR